MDERYQFYKEHKICVHCGQLDARRGRVLCPNCAEEASERQRRRRATDPAFREAHNKRTCEDRFKRGEKYSKTGLCKQCGKRAPKEGRKSCSVCLYKSRESKERSNRKKGIEARFLRLEQGRCYFCGGEITTKGMKLCDNCRAKIVNGLAIARAKKCAAQGGRE